MIGLVALTIGLSVGLNPGLNGTKLANKDVTLSLGAPAVNITTSTTTNTTKRLWYLF